MRMKRGHNINYAICKHLQLSYLQNDLQITTTSKLELGRCIPKTLSNILFSKYLKTYAVKYFRKKNPSYMLGRALSMPLQRYENHSQKTSMLIRIYSNGCCP